MGIYSSMIECTTKNSPGTLCKENDCCSGEDKMNWLLGNEVQNLIQKNIPLYILQPKPKTNKKASIFKIPGASNKVFARWWDEGGLHWKFYMNEDSVLFSTQHPTTFFYNCGTNSIMGTLGYDLKIKGGENLINYFSNLFQYQWSGAGHTGNVEAVKDENGVSHGGPDDLPCPDGSTGCCEISGTSCGSCFEGGAGNPVPDGQISKKILLIITGALAGIFLICAIVFRKKLLLLFSLLCLLSLGILIYFVFRKQNESYVQESGTGILMLREVLQ